MQLARSSKQAQAIIFDFDGTLVDSAPSMTRALNVMASRRGINPVDVRAVRRWVSRGGEVMLRGALGEMDDPSGDLEELRDLLRGQVADRADLYPGVPDTLEILKARGYRLGICTNKREEIAVPHAQDLGIAGYMDAIVGGAEGRHLKPHPELALVALDLLGAEAGDTMFVGDSEIDYETAIAAELPFVLVTFGYPHGDITAIPAQARVRSFEELPGIAETMLDLTPET